MRIHRIGLLGIALLTGFVHSQEANKLASRYGFEVDARLFPQTTPQDTMKSLVKAIGEDRFDYILAQLAEPAFVDAKVADYRRAFTEGSERSKTVLAFRRLVKETSGHFREEPTLVRELRLLAKDAKWEMDGEETATGSHAQLPGRLVILRRHEERWFLDNRQKK